MDNAPQRTARVPARVVVTGIGVLSGFGNGLAALEDGLFSGRTAIRRIESLDTRALTCHFGAELPAFDGQALIQKAERHAYDRVSLMALAAADEALAQAGLDPAEIGPTAGVMMGTAFGPGDAIQDAVLRASENQRLRPTTILKMMLNGPTAALCARYRLQRGSQAHVTACAASAHAIAQAVQAVRWGEMDVCLAGGADAFPTSALFTAWDALAIMSAATDPTAGIMKPFAPDRSGFVIGEAATVLILEREDHAIARGATPLAEICGAGAVTDTPTLTKPTLRGMVGAMRAALEDAGLDPAAVGHINAHGTATELNDSLESDAIRAVFGPHAPAIRVSACKAALGHCMGAGSAVEAAATILALCRQQSPWTIDPTAVTADPQTGPQPTAPYSGQTVPMDTDIALSNSFAFGGHYATLAFRVTKP
ncbi:beta-ketoacyl-[acyl-carrier-protein] synthase family protein [Novispirillum itersonii]|uniref:Nodulation protein E n=1 Tax=Novispirillum itersonii TaxID=189 RepID=A0A7X0DNQ1_NOVIT|nr:beta-ketoacyl-[acyl-carrier-protein] synthase family protein [Novispirillum itersonii]MBB6212220.1 3-oxoacyl-(acyl-carrier-protein) synthase [Novispirillum itersonii]